MSVYAIGITPLLRALEVEKSVEEASHEAFADDLSCAGKLKSLRKWWDDLVRVGTLFGYYPNAFITWVICKDNFENEATRIFAGTNILITKEGERHLGAAIVSETFKTRYVKSKVGEWVSQINKLAKIAEIDPHSAFCAFTFGIKNRWNYLMRSLGN